MYIKLINIKKPAWTNCIHILYISFLPIFSSHTSDMISWRGTNGGTETRVTKICTTWSNQNSARALLLRWCDDLISEYPCVWYHERRCLPMLWRCSYGYAKREMHVHMQQRSVDNESAVQVICDRRNSFACGQDVKSKLEKTARADKPVHIIVSGK